MIIYLSILNGKPYVGQTSDLLERRIQKHKSVAFCKPNDYFHKAIAFYGIDKCQWKILYVCSSKEDMDVMERFFIKLYGSHKSEGGYNLTWGGQVGSFLGCKHTGKTRTSLSKIHKEITSSPGWREEKSRVTKSFWDNCSQEYKMEFGKLVSEAMNTDDVRRKITSAHKGKPGYVGQIAAASKNYLLISPDGVEIVVTNLSKYCRENGIHRNYLRRVACGHRPHYKGWKCRRIE